jgi:Flp pilus assembly protein TadD
MKNKKTELLFSLLLFSAAIVLTGCSLTGTRPASGRFEATGKSSSRDASDQLSGVNQKRHGDNSENAVQRELKAPGDSETAGMARLMLGILSYEKGDFEKAIGYLESMQDDARDPFLVSKVLGLSHFRLDQYPQAIRHLRKAHQLNPNDGEILYSLGLIYEKENAAEEAK